MFRAAILALIASATTATFAPNGDIAADSPLGARILSKATVIEDARHLEQGDRDVTFVASYSLRYVGCSSLVQVNQEGQNENGGMLYTQHLVKFTLCPGTGCSSCSNGGEYVVNMEEFVDLYTEHKLNDKEWHCEMIRENCYCDNYNDDEVCENQCYTNAGMTECIEYEGEEEFEVQRYMECQEMEGGNNNNNQNNGQNYNYQNGEAYYGNYYVGPYCAKDGKSIHLGVFKDQGCSVQADDAVYASKNYGVALPFSSSTGTPLVSTSDCISCVDVERENNNNNNNNNNNGNNNNNNQNNPEVNELCENSYEMAARCETNMDIYYKDTTACDYINNILPRLEGASRSIGVKAGNSGKGAKAFATIFAFTTALFAGYAYFLYRKIKRGSVNLAAQE